MIHSAAAKHVQCSWTCVTWRFCNALCVRVWTISIDVKLAPVSFNWKLLQRDVACVDSSQFLHARFSFAVIALQYSHVIFFKQGAHGHLDGMGQRRPIQVAVQTHLQFLNRDGVWPIQEPPCRFSTRITSGFWIQHMNGWRWLLIFLSAQLAQSETAANLLSTPIFCLYFGVLPGFFWFYSILQSGDERIFLSLHTKHPPVPVWCNWIVFACQMHSTTEFAMTVLSKCVTHAGFVKVAWTLRGIPF